jgi:phage-related tail protein
LTKAAESNAKRLGKSIDEYMDHIDRQMVYFSHSINTMGAVFDKYLDVLNSYIPSIIK